MPRFWIKLVLLVGFTFVYPPFSPTYTISPSLNAEVSTPLINPESKALPSEPLVISSSKTKVAGIEEATEAEAGITSETLPAGGDAEAVE